MKFILYEILTWLSGSDRTILSKCSQSEHIKHAGIGTLLLIPLALGVISMTYAISLINSDAFVCVSVGLLWGVCVLLIDRFIVSTMKKGKYLYEDIFTPIFFIRILFAAGIGIVTSHPLVLLIFNDKVGEKLTEIKNRKEVSIQDFYKFRKDSLQADFDTAYHNNVVVRKEFVDQKNELLIAEVAGKSINIPGIGESSGKRGEGISSSLLKTQIVKYYSEIDNLEKSYSEKRLQLNIELAKLDSLKEQDLYDLKTNFSTDYLAREMALNEIIKSPDIYDGGSIVGTTMYFLFIFFLLVDITPVTLKVFMKRGEYDVHLQTREDTIFFRKEKELEINKSYLTQNSEATITEIETIFSQKIDLKSKKDQIALILGDSLEPIHKNEPLSPILEPEVNARTEKESVVKIIQSRVIFIIFVTVVLTAQYQVISYLFKNDKEKWPIVVPMVLTCTVTVFANMVPGKK